MNNLKIKKKPDSIEVNIHIGPFLWYMVSLSYFNTLRDYES